ncbi:collagen alpha-6(VI) chain [Gastrophryne carolinensis]
MPYGDVIFLLDGSDNIGEKIFNQLKSFVSRTISQFQIGADLYRFGLVKYSEDTEVGFLMSEHKTKNQILNYIKNKFLFKGGSLKTGNALSKVHEIFLKDRNGREKHPQVLVVVTSGSSTDDVKSSAVALKRDNVRIITLGLKQASLKDLEAMASSTELAFKIDNLRDLSTFSKDMAASIEKAVHKRYVESTEEIMTTAITPAVTTDTPGNGTASNETLFCKQSLASDVVLMVDISQHSPSDSKSLITFLKNITMGLEISNVCVHVAVVVFNSKARVITTLDMGVNQTFVEQIMAELKPSSMKISNIGSAINFTRTNVFGDIKASRKHQGIHQIGILVTHSSSADSISEAAKLLHQEGVKVFTVGIAKANDTQLSQILSYPPDQYGIRVKTFSDLSGQSDILLKKISNAIDRASFAEPKITENIRQGCLDTDLADIYLLIDGSGSIEPQDFIDIKAFLVELVEMFDIGPEKVRVAAFQYAQDRQQEFSINTEYSKTSLKSAIHNIRQIGGGTDTGAAINFTRQYIVDPNNARAQKVPVYLIVLTDGESQDSVKEAAKLVRDDNVIVYAIGVKEANQTQLLEIAGEQKRVHYVFHFDSLKDIKNVIAQQICSSKACEQVAADVMFLVDSSWSIGLDNFNKMKTFMKSLVNKTEVGPDRVQFGIVQFSDTPMEVLQLSKNGTKDIIYNAIDNMNHIAQNTFTGKALTFVNQYFKEEKGARPKIKKFLILITDGEAQDEVKAPAEALRNSGVIVLSVGIFNANKSQLLEISGKVEHVRYLETFDKLDTVEEALIFGICSPEKECSRIQVADIVFVIDSSGSINPQQYSTMKNFIISLVNKSDVGPTKVQFGALKYSDDPQRLFYLNQYKSKREIIEAIQNDPPLGGNTYTAEALDFSNQFFTEKHGSRQRSGVPQILMIITDGESHDRDKLNETARALQDAGVVLYAIGVAQAQTEELQTMAGTKGKWFFVENFDGLKDILTNVSEDACKKSDCETKETDLIFLIDGSTSISDANFLEIKKFMVSIVDDFDVRPGGVHVGVAQYSDKYRVEFSLKQYTDKETLKDKIGNITQIKGNTLIGRGLTRTGSELLGPSAKTRIDVKQMLLVITDGNSQDEVAKPAEDLRSKGIDIYAVGVGQVSESQLLQIAGLPSSKFSVDNFNELKNIKQRIVREVCTPPVANNCSADVVVAFDISSYTNGAALLHGQKLLEKRLDNILRHMTDVRSPSCGHGVKPQISVAFYIPNAKTQIPPLFQIYSTDMARNLKTVNVTGPSFLNSTILNSAWETFKNKNTGKAKMLLVFTDGLDDDVEVLEEMVEGLRTKGLSALVTVSLEGSKHFDDFKYIEFGRGFEYDYQMHIGMPNIEEALSQQMGFPGSGGARGYSGEEGLEGPRGFPGPKGQAGEKGCIGFKGPKGSRGLSGDHNEPGEPGLDGMPGDQGKYGHPGIKGEKGETGEAGSPGIRGPPGERGSKGFRGDPGEPGIPDTSTGPKGLKGEHGIEGEPGKPGIPGEPGVRASGVRSNTSHEEQAIVILASLMSCQFHCLQNSFIELPSLIYLSYSKNLPGRRGATGLPGTKGDAGGPGLRGDQGAKGPQGEQGNKGSKGEKGTQGPNGLPGPFGGKGSAGSPGNTGAAGKKGETGDPGEPGNPGPRGQRGLAGDDGKPGFGAPGKKGAKGERGFPGNSGIKGEQGDPGVVGEHGRIGAPGQSVSPPKGAAGDPGPPGPPGRRPCDLIDFIRKTCPCCQGKPACPVYPTELVFALDMANGMTPETYKRMIEILTSLLSELTIRENNCPVGARVAVVSYSTNTKYLLRFSDFQSRDKLITAVKNIPLERTSNGRNVGNCMRFVARNLFKRSLQGATVRRIAVFFTNGPSEEVVSINTAVMEYTALGIIPAIISFTPLPAIKRAFSIDDTGTFQVIDIPASGDYKPSLKTLQACTFCYDRCSPDPQCLARKPVLERVPMDMVFVMDSSYNMKKDDFQEAKRFISAMIDRLNISNTGDRVALVSNTPSGVRPSTGGSPHVEFDLSTYANSLLIKKHLQENTSHLQGPPALGFTLQWTVENIMSKASHLRKHKAIILILSGETSLWDREVLHETSLNAKCQGFPLFVLFIGKTYDSRELADLASFPTDHHLLQLGRIHKPDFGYALGFLHCFLNSIRRSMNKYPPPELKTRCAGSRSTRRQSAVEKASFQFRLQIHSLGVETGKSYQICVRIPKVSNLFLTLIYREFKTHLHSV